MENSAEILQAAQRLGETLNSSPTVQAYLQAEAAVQNSQELQQMEAKLDQVYNDLVRRQQAGEMLYPYEVNEFYKLRDQFVGHPLIKQRSASLEAVKTLFQQAGSAMSSIMSVEYTDLVG